MMAPVVVPLLKSVKEVSVATWHDSRAATAAEAGLTPRAGAKVASIASDTDAAANSVKIVLTDRTYGPILGNL